MLLPDDLAIDVLVIVLVQSRGTLRIANPKIDCLGTSTKSYSSPWYIFRHVLKERLVFSSEIIVLLPEYLANNSPRGWFHCVCVLTRLRISDDLLRNPCFFLSANVVYKLLERLLYLTRFGEVRDVISSVFHGRVSIAILCQNCWTAYTTLWISNP